MYTEDTLQVHPIDKEKLMQEVNEQIRKRNPGSKTYRINRTYALVLEPKLSILDTECCGSKHEPFEIGLFAEWKESEHKVMEIMASMLLNLTKEQLEPFLKEPISLRQFMGDRYNYNGRIQSNLSEWLRFFNKE